MVATCRRAVAIGLPALAFTEHADFVQVHGGQRELDIAGYLAAVERCRREFPTLVILSGVELGEPHLHPEKAAAVLAAGPLDRVLGSVHCLTLAGRLRDMSERDLITAENGPAIFRAYLAEVLALAASPQPYQILAHLDYAKRYWPHGEVEFQPQAFEAEYRAVLRALAARGSVVEVNTTRGADPRRGLCPAAQVLRWWREEGGRAVSFGSDTHEPGKVAAGFELAGQVVEAAGFHPSPNPAEFWRR